MPMFDEVSASVSASRISSGTFVTAGLVLGLLVVVFGLVLGPVTANRERALETARMLQARDICLALFQYANDHGGNYPDGKSSTEIFQQLLDEKYAGGANLFYIPLPGKVAPVAGQKLKPENVSFDVTAGADAPAPAALPLVFMTGYRVTYVPGGAAVRISPPPPSSLLGELSDWLLSPDVSWKHGIPTAYAGPTARFLRHDPVQHPDGTIPDFVPPDFKPDGKIYRQLTPDGPLP